MAVFRNLGRVVCGALFALSVVFVTNMVFACADNEFMTTDGCVEAKFTLTTSATNSFQFKMSAAGTFYVDCGNGGTLSGSGVSGNTVINRTGTSEATYTCAYSDSVARTIRFGGLANGYSTTKGTAAIRFSTKGDLTEQNTPKIKTIDGSLGAIFPTLNDGSNDLSKQPSFCYTFYLASEITSVPSGLFSGVRGSADRMFSDTFGRCYKISAIPSGLFSNITGAAEFLFNHTFGRLYEITSVPSGLFSGVSGTAKNLFSNTFLECTKLTTVPADLFSGLSGTIKQDMLAYTFKGDTLLNTFDWGNGVTTNYIPTQFFGNLSNQNLSNYMRSCFENTSVATSCPVGTYKYDKFASVLNPKVMCASCPTLTNGYQYSTATGLTAVTQCQEIKPASSVNDNCYSGSLTKTATNATTWGDATSTLTAKAGYEVTGSGDNATCSTCAMNTYNATNGATQCTECPVGTYSPVGAWKSSQCGHILHVGDYQLYMHGTKDTVPSLNAMLSDGSTWHANTTQTPTYISSGIEHYLQVNYDGQNYYVCDDTMCPM